MYRLIGYRKKVVFTNLKNSFSIKSDEELNAIMVNFFSHLCDIIMESVKGFIISEKELRKRLVIKNNELSK